jgi:trans-aconitate methyltransferase
VTEVYGAHWYDVAMTEPDAPAMLPLEESPWLPVYQALSRMIEPHEEVVDLGCGTGRFVAQLRRNEHYAKITGIDWSLRALDEATRYNQPGEVPFLLQDLDEWEPDPDRAGNTVFVCSEVLEHLKEDLGLVGRVPPGHRFLFTVPNFHSPAHVRVFSHVGDIWSRYAGLLVFLSWRMVGTERHGIHVLESVRRADAW